MPLSVLSICLTYHFRVNVRALLSLVGPAHQLLLPLAAFKCDVFSANKTWNDLIWHRMIGPWNSLPANDEHFKSLSSFKAFLKHVDLTKFLICTWSLECVLCFLDLLPNCNISTLRPMYSHYWFYVLPHVCKHRFKGRRKCGTSTCMSCLLHCETYSELLTIHSGK